MIFGEIGIIIIIVGILFFGGYLVVKNMKRPEVENIDLDVSKAAFDACRIALQATIQEVEEERDILRDLTNEMASALMLSSGRNMILPEEQEHEMHVSAELDRRREDKRAKRTQQNGRE